MKKFSKKDINFLKNLSKDAGKIITGFHKEKEVYTKNDSSPVTNADIMANKFIVDGLSNNFPNISVISEEQKPILKSENNFFLVDPLDGTKEFISGSDEFTVNIAYIENGDPILGFIYIPLRSEIYWTDGLESFFEKQEKMKIKTDNYENEINLELSKSHLDENTKSFIEKIKAKNINYSGSSIKLCNLAKGTSNLYPRLSKTMEWDIAAGHAILKNAGGDVFEINGKPVRYNKHKYTNNPFIAFGGKKLPEEVIKTLKIIP